MYRLILIWSFLTCSASLFSQSGDTLVIRDLQQALDVGVEYNAAIKKANAGKEQAAHELGTASDIGKTGVYHSYDANNLAQNNRPLRVYGIYQTIPFPTTFGRKRNLYESQTQQALGAYDLAVWKLKEDISKAYYSYVYCIHLLCQFSYLDSIFGAFANAANQRYEVGESTYLEKISARNKHQQQRMMKMQVQEELKMAHARLAGLLQAPEPIQVEYTTLQKLAWPWEGSSRISPGQRVVSQAVDLAKSAWKVSKSATLPDLTFEYFRGFGLGENSENFNGYMVGLEIPVWFKPFNKSNQALKVNTERALYHQQDFEARLLARRQALAAELQKYEAAILYYEEEGLATAEEIQATAVKSYYAGEIGYMNYIRSLEDVSRTYIQYLQDLNYYNQTYISMYYLTEID